MKILRKNALVLLVVLLAAGALSVALWPRAVEVDAAEVRRGTLVVTVNEDGRTRVKERYLVSSPLSGRLARITLDAGDAIEAGKTLLAVLDPMDPALLDPRARAEAEARVRAAEAALERAEPGVARADAALELAQNELRRRGEMRAAGGGTDFELEKAQAAERMATAERRAAGFARDIAVFELEQARAALLRTSPDGSAGADWRFEIRSPIDGRVLRLLQESAGVVSPGTPLLEVGNTAELEIAVDVLSSDGVRIRPGARVSIEHWGEREPLEGVVRLVEPSAFTKISALGVEEQRVNVIIDFTGPPERREGLGDGFRVEARIVTDEREGVVLAPVGALFRPGGGGDRWAVYALAGGRARVREVEIGLRNDIDAEVVAGLAPGEMVVAYPGDRVREGVRVRVREGR